MVGARPCACSPKRPRGSPLHSAQFLWLYLVAAISKQECKVMSNKPEINFTRGVPATESFPVEDVIAASKLALEKYGTTILQYGKSYGFQPLREWLAEWQGVAVDQVLTANGSL